MTRTSKVVPQGPGPVQAAGVAAVHGRHHPHHLPPLDDALRAEGASRGHMRPGRNRYRWRQRRRLRRVGRGGVPVPEHKLLRGRNICETRGGGVRRRNLMVPRLPGASLGPTVPGCYPSKLSVVLMTQGACLPAMSTQRPVASVSYK